MFPSSRVVNKTKQRAGQRAQTNWFACLFLRRPLEATHDIHSHSVGLFSLQSYRDTREARKCLYSGQVFPSLRFCSMEEKENGIGRATSSGCCRHKKCSFRFLKGHHVNQRTKHEPDTKAVGREHLVHCKENFLTIGTFPCG